jgi:hypothetical protein
MGLVPIQYHQDREHVAATLAAVALDQMVEIYIPGTSLATVATEEATKSVTAGPSNARLVLAKHALASTTKLR